MQEGAGTTEQSAARADVKVAQVETAGAALNKNKKKGSKKKK